MFRSDSDRYVVTSADANSPAIAYYDDQTFMVRLNAADQKKLINGIINNLRANNELTATGCVYISRVADTETGYFAVVTLAGETPRTISIASAAAKSEHPEFTHNAVDDDNARVVFGYAEEQIDDANKAFDNQVIAMDAERQKLYSSAGSDSGSGSAAQETVNNAHKIDTIAKVYKEYLKSKIDYLAKVRANTPPAATQSNNSSNTMPDNAYTNYIDECETIIKALEAEITQSLIEIRRASQVDFAATQQACDLFREKYDEKIEAAFNKYRAAREAAAIKEAKATEDAETTRNVAARKEAKAAEAAERARRVAARNKAKDNKKSTRNPQREKKFSSLKNLQSETDELEKNYLTAKDQTFAEIKTLLSEIEAAEKERVRLNGGVINKGNINQLLPVTFNLVNQFSRLPDEVNPKLRTAAKSAKAIKAITFGPKQSSDSLDHAQTLFESFNRENKDYQQRLEAFRDTLSTANETLKLQKMTEERDRYYRSTKDKTLEEIITLLDEIDAAEAERVRLNGGVINEGNKNQLLPLTFNLSNQYSRLEDEVMPKFQSADKSAKAIKAITFDPATKQFSDSLDNAQTLYKSFEKENIESQQRLEAFRDTLKTAKNIQAEPPTSRWSLKFMVTMIGLGLGVALGTGLIPVSGPIGLAIVAGCGAAIGATLGFSFGSLLAVISDNQDAKEDAKALADIAKPVAVAAAASSSQAGVRRVIANTQAQAPAIASARVRNTDPDRDDDYVRMPASDRGQPTDSVAATSTSAPKPEPTLLTSKNVQAVIDGIKSQYRGKGNNAPKEVVKMLERLTDLKNDIANASEDKHAAALEYFNETMKAHATTNSPRRR